MFFSLSMEIQVCQTKHQFSSCLRLCGLFLSYSLSPPCAAAACSAGAASLTAVAVPILRQSGAASLLNPRPSCPPAAAAAPPPPITMPAQIRKTYLARVRGSCRQLFDREAGAAPHGIEVYIYIYICMYVCIYIYIYIGSLFGKEQIVTFKQNHSSLSKLIEESG